MWTQQLPKLGLLLLLAQIDAAKAQTINEWLPLALKRSGEVTQQRAKLHESETEVDKAVSGAEPTVKLIAEAATGTDRVTGGSALENSLLASSLPRRSYDVEIEQPLFLSGRVYAEFSASIDEVRSQAAKLEADEQDALAQTSQDYIDLIYAKEDARLVSEETTLSNEASTGTQAERSVGEVSRVEELEARSAQLESYAEQNSANSRLVHSQETFEQDVGVPVNATDWPNFNVVVPTSEQEVIALADTSPAILSAEFEERAAHFDVADARAQGRPEITLNASLSENDGAVFPAERQQVRKLGIQLHAPIFSGGAVRAAVKHNEAMEEYARTKTDDTRIKAESAAIAAYRQITPLKQAWEAYSASVAAYQELVEGKERLFTMNNATRFDLIQAKRNLIEENRKQIKARHDYVSSLITLLQSEGHFGLSDLRLGNADPETFVSRGRLLRNAISIPFIR